VEAGMITRVDHVHVTTTDMDQSIAFYTDLLGFKFLRRGRFGPSENHYEFAYVGLGDILLQLVPGPEPLGIARRPFALTVDNMERTLADLRMKGVEVTAERRPGSSFTGLTACVKDPSGVVIELREWDASDGPQYSDWQPEDAEVVRTA
jgi:catechol 2,3-dioxygenase-like lactoylglutathione lyase family enzyme